MHRAESIGRRAKSIAHRAECREKNAEVGPVVVR